MTGKVSEQNMQELDTDIVETSAHAGARPDHAVWQGRWFSFSGKSTAYPSLVAETGYGTGAGLKGWNCRHDFYPVIPGISEPSYTEEELANIDPPPIEYNGKTLTYYECTQKQRAMETAIRRTKREIIAAEASGDEDMLTAKSILLRRQREEYAKFSKEAGLLTQNERTQVYGFGKSVAQKARWKAQKALDNGDGSGIIDINIDEFVPCLKNAKTGEILETEVARMNKKELSTFNVKTGWGDNWSNRPKNEKVYGVFLKGDAEPQGLISLRNDKGGTYIGFASTAPHNNKQIVGDNQTYLGVGGHLFALAVEESLKNGGHGTIYGYAANKQVLDHYIQKFGAIHLPYVHEYQFIIEGEASERLLDIYNYERRKQNAK